MSSVLSVTTNTSCFSLAAFIFSKTDRGYGGWNAVDHQLKTAQVAEPGLVPTAFFSILHRLGFAVVVPPVGKAMDHRFTGHAAGAPDGYGKITMQRDAGIVQLVNRVPGFGFRFAVRKPEGIVQAIGRQVETDIVVFKHIDVAGREEGSLVGTGFCRRCVACR